MSEKLKEIILETDRLTVTFTPKCHISYRTMRIVEDAVSSLTHIILMIEEIASLRNCIKELEAKLFDYAGEISELSRQLEERRGK